MDNLREKQLAQARAEEQEAAEFVRFLIQELKAQFNVRAQGFLVQPEVKVKTTKKQK